MVESTFRLSVRLPLTASSSFNMARKDIIPRLFHQAVHCNELPRLEHTPLSAAGTWLQAKKISPSHCDCHTSRLLIVGQLSHLRTRPGEVPRSVVHRSHWHRTAPRYPFLPSLHIAPTVDLSCLALNADLQSTSSWRMSASGIVEVGEWWRYKNT